MPESASERLFLRDRLVQIEQRARDNGVGGELGRRKGCRGRRGCVPLHIAVRRAGPEMRACLWPIVEAEYGSNHSVQLVGQMDRSGPAAVGAAVVFELLQIHAERILASPARWLQSNPNDAAFAAKAAKPTAPMANA